MLMTEMLVLMGVVKDRFVMEAGWQEEVEQVM